MTPPTIANIESDAVAIAADAQKLTADEQQLAADAAALQSLTSAPPATSTIPTAPGPMTSTTILQPASTGPLVSSSAPVQLNETLQAIIKMPSGNTYLFDEAAGANMGDYVDPALPSAVHCVAVKFAGTVQPADVAIIPFMTVWFRRDATSPRAEAIFEYGLADAASNALITLVDTGPYSVTILQNNVVLASNLMAPHHWLFARWRWQSARRPILFTVAQLVAMRLVEPRANVGIPITALPAQPAYQQAMDVSGMDPTMGTTGERVDIGPATDVWGHYQIDPGDPVTTQALFDWAEATGSIPMYLRLSGSCINMQENPTANIYYAPPQTITGSGWIRSTQASAVFGVPGSATNPCPFSLNTAHWPNSAWAAWLLTRDPYFLEAMQFSLQQWLWGDLWDAPLLYAGEVRGFAYGLNMLIQLLKAIPSSVPSWLLPLSYYQGLETAELAWVAKNFTNCASAGCTRFFLGPMGGVTNEPWQMEFLGFVAEKAVYMGFFEFQPLADYCWNNTNNRINGKTGWPPEACTTYVADWAAAGSYGSPPAGLSSRSPACIPDASYCATYNTAWNATAADPTNNFPAGPTGTNLPTTIPTSAGTLAWYGNTAGDYLHYTRGHLALRTQNKPADASVAAAFADADQMAKSASPNWSAPWINAKWSIPSVSVNASATAAS